MIFFLIFQRVNEHRGKIAKLNETITEIKANPKIENNEAFEKEIEKVKDRVADLLEDVSESLS